ncbi:MAG: 4Fe-4S binding protein [Candidatus Latescibacteria bacterium]|nr:4Fe-4S binding protein [bacterium]MBD3423919.1 4Fe-4S binding protein [Candidatus Latescibacterota bacterium]
MNKTKTIALSFLLNLVPASHLLAYHQKQHVIKRKIGLSEFISSPEYIGKYILMAAIGVIAFFILKSGKMNKPLKSALLLLSLILFGLAGNILPFLELHPTPVCVVTKPVHLGLRAPFLIYMILIAGLTLLGPKLYCGWVCPVGAVQELISMVTDRFKIPAKNFSFRLSNSVRVAILAIFIVLSAAAFLGGNAGGSSPAASFYGYFNPFYGMDLGSQPDMLEYAIRYLPLIITVILALFLYRPFCHFVCPVGLLTNMLEQGAAFRISLNRRKCTSCTLCLSRSPCKALPYILNGYRYRADCFACNRCLEECRKDALMVSNKKTIGR